jgi:cytochrome b
VNWGVQSRIFLVFQFKKEIAMTTVRIWDLPTRLFHWFLACAVLGLIVTGQIGGDAMVWHFRLGFAVLTLLLFRGLWGFVGGHWSRWTQLALSPRQALAYVRAHSPQVWVGHNPLGSWSVVLMLCWLLLQAATGLVSDDEIANAGPLTTLVTGTTVSLATAWHKSVGKMVLILLVLTHVGAIVWYRWRKSQPLVAAMWHGDKVVVSSEVPPSRDGMAQRSLALVLLLACAAAVRWLVGLGG